MKFYSTVHSLFSSCAKQIWTNTKTHYLGFGFRLWPIAKHASLKYKKTKQYEVKSKFQIHKRSESN